MKFGFKFIRIWFIRFVEPEHENGMTLFLNLTLVSHKKVI